MRSPSSLVAAFGSGDGAERFAAYQRLVALGADALPAIRSGLASDDWRVRHWSAICMDRVADEDAYEDLIPLLSDPHPKVRLWAVHALACDHCKDDVSCPVDVVPLLIERIQTDPSVRVRRMAVIMLTTDFRDARARKPLEAVLSTTDDRKLRLHAEDGLRRLAEAGL
ncbi:MAG: HEAT repeat domain-containing protein [Rhodothermales bacterium]|nr:HEAT repeat domain-containing protein [Rhodothermales bacterium]